MKTLFGLEEWGLTLAELPALDSQASVSILLTYSDYKSLLAYAPAERMKRTAARLRQDYKVLKELLRGLPFERRGTHIKPQGARVELPLNRLPDLLAAEVVRDIFIETVAGREQVDEAEEVFWCVKARFAVRVENQTKGNQLFDDQLLLVRARSEEEAKTRLLGTIEKEAEPYIGGGGRLVRWQFEEILAIDCLNAASLDAAVGEGYLEVYSKLGGRKLRPEQVWTPRHD